MSSNLNPYAYLQNEIIPLKSAYLHVSDLAIQRGYGVFDFFKIQNSTPLFLQDYLTRFYSSALMMGLEVPLSEREITEVILELIQRNEMPESGMKMILTGGYSANGYDPAEPNLIITQHSLPMPTEQQVNNGIKIITAEYIRELARAKTINYSMGIRLIQQVKSKGADDVLYHQNGVVTEFPRSNFFIVKQDNTVATPAQEVLMGITRKNVLELAAKRYNVEEAEVTLQDIANAKEAFMTSTTKRVLSIVEIDGRPIGNGKVGEVSKTLLQDLIEFEERQIEE
ncbi:aminotransferase class IV [Rufibacter roseus]|uniref:branched-chain-amino-acid transaminase n=1 Tax=Rufibacter roseus TaxID=1567108 RepID=A0ABW2DTX3_9BACT|nr:aminotransferase class IV [Rufibacter roseus]